ncbi:unnamed protein product, partial [Ilex paraguariensis]
MPVRNFLDFPAPTETFEATYSSIPSQIQVFDEPAQQQLTEPKQIIVSDYPFGEVELDVVQDNLKIQRDLVTPSYSKTLKFSEVPISSSSPAKSNL